MTAQALRKAGAAASILAAAMLAGACASPRAQQRAADAVEPERQAAAVSESGADGVAARPRDDAEPNMPGSSAARDDLYCWAILGVHFDAQNIAASGEADRFLAAQKRLEASGVARLTDEGVTAVDDWASRTVAYAEAARADYRRNTLRLSPDTCLARAAGLEKQGR